MTDKYNWDALAEQAEAGTLAPLPATAVRGEEAARAGRAALLTATGAGSIDEAKRIALGRPRLTAKVDETVTWKVRASSTLDTIVSDLAEREGRTRSALVRDAVVEYVRTHAPN